MIPSLSLESLQHALQAAPLSIMLYAEDGEILLVNQEWCRSTGYDADHFSTMQDWLTTAFGLNREQANGLLKRQRLYEAPQYEGSYLLNCANGRRLNWECYASRLQRLADGRYLIMRMAVDTSTRQQTDTLLQVIAHGIGATTGQAFFESLVSYLAQTLNVEHAFIATLQEGEPPRARTQAWFAHGKLAPQGFEYTLTDTPCATLLAGDLCIYADNVCERFPDDSMLRRLGAVSYAGVALFGARRQPLGILAVMDRQPLEQRELVATLLRILAGRVTSELERLQSEQALQASEHRFRTLVELSPHSIQELDRDGTILFANPASHRILDYTPGTLVGKNLADVLAPEFRATVMEALSQPVQEPSPTTPDHQVYQTQHGEPVHMEVFWDYIRDGGGNVSGFVSIARNITQRLHDEEQLRKLSKAIEQSPVSTIITDTQGVIEYVNPAFEQNTGYSAQEALGQKTSLLKSGYTDATCYQELWEAILNGQDWSGELHNRRKDGSLIWEYTRISPLTDEQGRITHFLSTKEDITQRKTQEELLLQHTYYDQLTQLPNRVLAFDRLAQALRNARQHDTKVALLSVDLDEFKKVNDTFTHSAGDTLLVAAAQRLVQVVGDEQTVARLAGDEFLVMLESLADIGQAEQLAQQILEAFHQPFELDGQPLTVTASIGLTLFPDDGDNASILMRNADSAVHKAKRQGTNSYSFFTPGMDQQARQRLLLETHLRQALARNELYLNYQPLVRATDGCPVGAEVLLRWHNPELGEVTPAQFIPLAEETGLINEIGDWVLRTACHQGQQWRQQGLPLQRLAVNVSPRQFSGGDFAERTLAILTTTGLPADCLELEVTEGVLINNVEHTSACLRRLKTHGVRLSIDDFGTGYSSLSYLRRLPLDVLKIDRAFIMEIEQREEDRTLVNAIVAMAHGMGLRVVAEGVESPAQRDYLIERGCDLLQGYLFSRPLAAPAFEQFLQQSRAMLPDA